MSLSSFALILGIVCYTVGFSLIFSAEGYIAWARKALLDLGVVRTLGILAIIIAVTTLRHHWRISPDGEGIVIVLAWMTLIKGLVVAWVPGPFLTYERRFAAVMLRSPVGQLFVGCIAILFAAALSFLGFSLA